MNEKERSKIVEEETLRAETRQKLGQHGVCSQAMGHGCHRCRFYFWIILGMLILGICHGMGRFHGWCGYDKADAGHGMMAPESAKK